MCQHSLSVHADGRTEAVLLICPHPAEHDVRHGAGTCHPPRSELRPGVQILHVSETVRTASSSSLIGWISMTYANKIASSTLSAST